MDEEILVGLEPVRILRIQSRICIGGPALNTILLSSGLREEGFQTLLVGGKLEPGETAMTPMVHQKGVALHHLEEMGRTISWVDDLRALRKLIRIIRLYKPHVVHTHTAKAGALGRIAAFICRVPVRVHTFHGHVFKGYFNPVMNKVFILTERFLAALSHGIVAISPTQKKDLTEIYKAVPKKKCRVIRLGFELEKMVNGIPGRFRESIGVGPETRLVGILARLVPIKNHELFLEAVAVWRRLNPEMRPEQIRFLVLGDGELRDDLEQKARDLGIDSLVMFCGWRRDTADIYADLDLNMLVSKNEGTPVTLIEGLACGVPILSTNVGGICDFAGEEHGVILPADADPEAVGSALNEMLAKPKLRLDDPAREKILAMYSHRRLVSEMGALYRDLQGKRRDREN